MNGTEASRSYILREMRSGRRAVMEFAWPNGRPFVSGVEADEGALHEMVACRASYPWEKYGPGLTFEGWLYFETWDEAVAWVRER